MTVPTNYFYHGGADGYLAGPGSSLPEKYGPEYTSIYNSLQIDYNGFYSQRRQILLGFRLEY